jgi:hypothetical protein
LTVFLELSYNSKKAVPSFLFPKRKRNVGDNDRT